MTWFLLSILSTVLFSFTNFIDKYLISVKLSKLSSVSITALAGIAGLPLLSIFTAIILGIDKLPSVRTLVFGILASWFFMAGIQAYYYSLSQADTSIVASLFQLILPFNFIFGFVLFDELPSAIRLVGIILILCGSVLISIERTAGKRVFHKKVLLYMLAASLCISMSDVIFRIGTQQSHTVSVMFSEYLGTVLGGFMLILVPSIRRQVFGAFRKHRASILKITQINEAINLAGILCMRTALVLAPLVLVQAALGTQPLVLILVGALLTLLYPHKIQENIARTQLRSKLLAGSIIVAGSVLLVL